MLIPLYLDAATVVAALREAPDTTLAASATVGATNLSLQSNLTADQTPIYPGMSLALDQYVAGLRETVTVTGAVTGTGPFTVPVSTLAYAHVAGVPVKECSRFLDVIGAASRLVDDFCYTAAGAFAQQSWTETVMGQMQTDGRLYARVSGRNATAVSSFAWATDDGSSGTVAPSNLRLDDYHVWALPLTATTSNPSTDGLPDGPHWKNVTVTITYTAGYSPIPDDLARSAAIIAARLYKESEAGFADVTGSAETGVLEYRKAIPVHVRAMLTPWRRVV